MICQLSLVITIFQLTRISYFFEVLSYIIKTTYLKLLTAGSKATIIFTYHFLRVRAQKQVGKNHILPDKKQ